MEGTFLPNEPNLVQPGTPDFKNVLPKRTQFCGLPWEFYASLSGWSLDFEVSQDLSPAPSLFELASSWAWGTPAPLHFSATNQEAPAGPSHPLPSPCFVGHTPARMSKRFYLTTAIDYVNGQPHL